MSVLTPPAGNLVRSVLFQSRSARWRMSRRTRSAAMLTMAFWGSNYLLLTLGTALSGTARLGAIAEARIVTTMLGLRLCYLIHEILERIPTTKRRLVALALIAPVASEIFAWASFFAESAADPSIVGHASSWPMAVRTVALWTWFFLAWAGLYLALMYSFDVQEEQVRATKLREEAQLAQLRALQSQINPHFLFNSLNSVSSLILDRENELAEDVLLKLASFLRIGFTAEPGRKISLALEMEHQHSYLNIERLRFPDLIVSVAIPDRLHSALVPSLILQPIVENAIKHGVAGTPPPATLRIAACAHGQRLVITVVNSGGARRTTGGTGIGLANVRQRLELMYQAGRTSLSAGRDRDGRFRVDIMLPLEFA